MANYKTNHTILAFSIEGSDYISKQGDVIDLPEEHPYIQALEGKGHITKQLKSNKNE
jgi:hypothetical protein